MPEILEDVKRTFRKLVAKHVRPESIIELLVTLRAKVDLSVDDTGWVSAIVMCTSHVHLSFPISRTEGFGVR